LVCWSVGQLLVCQDCSATDTGECVDTERETVDYIY